MAIDFDSYGKVTSGYGNRNTGIAGASTNHKGIDIVMDSGKVQAFVGGTVVDMGTNSSAGNWVKVKQTDGYTATYMHMAHLPQYSVGYSVGVGDMLGIQGSTGISSGAHVHYQVQDDDGNYIDPTSSNIGSINDLYFAAGGSDVYEMTSQDRKTTIFGTIVKGTALVFIGVVAAFLFFKAFDIKII